MYKFISLRTKCKLVKIRGLNVKIHKLILHFLCKFLQVLIRVNYIVSPCGLHKITYLGTNSFKSPSRVLTFHFVTFEGINIVSPCGLHKITCLSTNRI
ncbi:hypothetical protein Hanom_Chr17g01529151 [Helianthus anomalus]